MDYRIFGRTISIDDKLVEKFLVLNNASEIEETSINNVLTIRIISKFGHNPSVQEISDEKLSLLCNSILLSELEFYNSFPRVIKTIEDNKDNFEKASVNNDLLEIDLRL